MVPAAEYVRMSTDHQRYSTTNQSEAIHSYAASHGLAVVRTYTDDGKSGLDIGGRDALRRLLEDVQSGRANFRVILVYDISRWGRFQNADEAAHYEYLCTKAGIRVIYCAEPFENDGSSLATIVKNVKRAMAGEYSRELSTKVFAGQCRLVRLGFHQGGSAGYGLRRVLLNEHRASKGELGFGEHKSIQTDRVVLAPGPQGEIDTVQRIYRDFVDLGMNEREIANALNAEGLSTDMARPWTRGTVHQVLTNEKYVGNNLYNRTSTKLRRRTVRNAPEHWIRCEGAFQGIVSVSLFQRVREIVEQRSRRLDDAQMLAMLRTLLDRAGALSGLIIDEQDDMPSSTAYQNRFGGLVRVYELIGYTPERDYRYLAINRALRAWHPQVLAEIVERFEGVGAEVKRDAGTDLLTINDEWTASVVVARCQATAAGSLRWKVRFDTVLSPDVTLAVRMDRSNSLAKDYYLIPRLDTGAWPRRLGEDNSAIIDSYRFETLDVLGKLAERVSLKEVA
nr:recombinase family protein [Solimonas terrae]